MNQCRVVNGASSGTRWRSSPGWAVFRTPCGVRRERAPVSAGIFLTSRPVTRPEIACGPAGDDAYGFLIQQFVIQRGA